MDEANAQPCTRFRQGRGRKILTYVYKPRQNSNRRRQGHRQDFTAVKIDAIDTTS